MEQRKIQENKFFCQSRKPPNNAKCAVSLLSGCAGGSDRRQRKATPKGVFGRTRRRTAWGLGKPQQASRKSEKDIPAHCLPTLSEISDKTGQQCFRNILLDIPKTLVGVPPKPRTGRFASSRTRLTAWLFRSLRLLLPAHPRRKNGAQPRPVRSVPVPAQYHRGKSAG